MSAHPGNLSRREFLKTATVAAAATALSPDLLRVDAAGAGGGTEPPMIGIQVGAVSFLDEGTEKVLDLLREKAAVNTIFAAAFTCGRGIAGRQVAGHPLPDHGAQEYDLKFHGGNFATPHPRFYEGTSLKAKDTKAPDHGDYDLLSDIVPKAHQRGMKVFAWYEDVFRTDIPGIEALRERDLEGRPASALCALHPDYRQFLIGLTQDFCESYEIDGLMWGCERQGPLNNAISSSHGAPGDPGRVTCFCELHQKAARDRGIDPGRALEGYKKLAEFVRAARADDRPNDGYFVEFWRLLLQYPELLAWEKLWTDSQQSIYADIFNTARKTRPSARVGFHIWHNNSFSPFFRAEQNYTQLAASADFLKIVMYNNCGGARYAGCIRNMASTIFRDMPADEVFSMNNHWLNYGKEVSLEKLSGAGLSSDYVFQETRRAAKGVDGKCRIYPGIDIDVPGATTGKQTSPEDVEAATDAAFRAGADGVLFSRKYSEMRLANLAAGGKAVRSWLAAK